MNRIIRHICQLIVVGIVVAAVLSLPAVVHARTSLSQLQAQINALQTQVDALETNKADQTQIDGLQTQIDDLQTQVDALGTGLAVFDDNGTKVGNVTPFDFSAGGSLSVAFIFDDQVFPIAVDADRIRGSGPNGFYQSVDCTGPFFISINPTLSPIFTSTNVAPPGHTLYIPDITAIPQTLIINSFLRTRNGDCISGIRTDSNMVPAVAVVDLDTLFDGPFSAR